MYTELRDSRSIYSEDQAGIMVHFVETLVSAGIRGGCTAGRARAAMTALVTPCRGFALDLIEYYLRWHLRLLRVMFWVVNIVMYCLQHMVFTRHGFGAVLLLTSHWTHWSVQV